MNDSSGALSWEDKFCAMQTLDPDISIKMLGSSGLWYVSSSIVYTKAVDRRVWNNINFCASTVAEAVAKSWEAVTFPNIIVRVDKDDVLVHKAGVPHQWKKFMWVKV